MRDEEGGGEAGRKHTTRNHANLDQQNPGGKSVFRVFPPAFPSEHGFGLLRENLDGWKRGCGIHASFRGKIGMEGGIWEDMGRKRKE